MHEQIVRDHAAINAQRAESDLRILFHRFHDFTRLIRSGLEHGAGEMALVCVARESRDYAARRVFPVGGEEAGECRDEIDAAIVVHRASEGFDVRALFDEAEVVAQPLHESAGDSHAAFERAAGFFLTEFVSDGCEQPEVRGHIALTGIH